MGLTAISSLMWYNLVEFCHITIINWIYWLIFHKTVRFSHMYFCASPLLFNYVASTLKEESLFVFHNGAFKRNEIKERFHGYPLSTTSLKLTRFPTGFSFSNALAKGSWLSSAIAEWKSVFLRALGEWNSGSFYADTSGTLSLHQTGIGCRGG